MPVTSHRPRTRPLDASAGELRGANQLVTEAITGTTTLVEAVHASILGWPRRLLGLAPTASTNGIPGLAYASVRGIARMTGSAIDQLLQRLPDTLASSASIPQREALLAVLNGVLGDHLAATGNPLAITPCLRRNGQALPLQRDALASDVRDARPRLLVMVHGLCMNDLQWRHGGHHHGVALADALNCSLVHLFYNSGLPIAENGRHLSDLLQRLTEAWPVPPERMAIIGHSMGGLVARAAIASAQADGSRWLQYLDQLVTLGTPHLGAPLERAGNLLQALLGSTPHSAPFVALSGLRSAGIQDLRQGLPMPRTPFPHHVQAYAVAASTQVAPTTHSPRRVRGDGLVPVASAFGAHRSPRLGLNLPPSHRLLVHDTGHIGLLGSAQVHAQLRAWLA